jgi:hypothetical protein
MLNIANKAGYLAWPSKRVLHLITTHPSIVISLIKQIQASITCEIKWLRWVWRKCKRKTNYISIHYKAPTPPQTKPYGWQTPISQLKKAAIKTQGFSMTKDNIPPETKANYKPPSTQGKSDQLPNSTKDADSSWRSNELRQTSRLT